MIFGKKAGALLYMTSKLLLAAAVVVVLMGVISYFTATGKAVIGVDPVSVEAQRAAIAVNAFWWLATCLIGSAIAHFAGNEEGK